MNVITKAGCVSNLNLKILEHKNSLLIPVGLKSKANNTIYKNMAIVPYGSTKL